jgi:CMP-N,N'-diacetyllegionaminic acid synthase
MILGLIPARGGSKGVPRKNIRMIAGKPLIAWTIEAALQSQKMDRVVVSTEDDEIAQIAHEWGAEVLKRPDELATDTASSLSVWQHALLVIPATIFVNLYPTSPIRDGGLIDNVIAQFLEIRPTCLATGFICKYLPFGDTDDGLGDIYGRQQIEGFFYDDGNMYVVDAQIILNGQQYGTRLAHYYTNRECNIEIDEEFDFWLAEQVLLKRNTITTQS